MWGFNNIPTNLFGGLCQGQYKILYTINQATINKCIEIRKRKVNWK